MGGAVEAAPSVFFRPALEQDLATICDLERIGYPVDEAATPQQLEFRLQNAQEYFLVAQGSESGVLGFICGTASSETRLTHSSMSMHDPEGTTLCVHSVCVGPSHRRRGIASRLLKAYTAYVGATAPHVEAILLLCKEALVPLYVGAGFSVVGPSTVVHGLEPWIEMRLSL